MKKRKTVVIIVAILLGIFLLVENSIRREKELIREGLQKPEVIAVIEETLNNLEKILVIKMSLNRMKLIMMKRILMLQEMELKLKYL